MVTNMTAVGHDRDGREFSVGDKVIEGWYVATVQRIFGKSAETALDSMGQYTLSKRVDQSYLLVVTAERLEIIRKYDAEEEQFGRLEKVHDQYVEALKKQLAGSR